MAEWETIFTPENFRFDDVSVEVTDVIPPGVQPSKHILDSNQGFQVTVSWKNNGLATRMVGGSWHLLLLVESIGAGPEKTLFDPDDHIIPLVPGPEPVVVSRTIDVPAGTLPVVGGHGVSLYKLVVVVTYFDATGARGPIALFQEGPIMQIYDSTL